MKALVDIDLLETKFAPFEVMECWIDNDVYEFKFWYYDDGFHFKICEEYGILDFEEIDEIKLAHAMALREVEDWFNKHWHSQGPNCDVYMSTSKYGYSTIEPNDDKTIRFVTELILQRR